MMIEYKDVEPIHLGGGIVLFENAIDLDWDHVFNISKEFVDEEWSRMYSPAVDPESGKDVYVNKSGYLYSKEDTDKMPKRAAMIHSSDDEEVAQLFNFVEESRDKYLLKYMELFPLVYKCIWWKIKGHVTCYGPGAFIGEHSDISTDYTYGYDHPVNQLASRNVVTVLVYMNDCVDSEDKLNDKNFTEGHHYFNYLDINYIPKKGDIIMFPSNYMAAHEVKPIGKGTRFAYLGWYCQGTPNEKVGEFVADPIEQPELAKKATNVYMPKMPEEYRKYLRSKGYEESSFAYRLTTNNF